MEEQLKAYYPFNRQIGEKNQNILIANIGLKDYK